MASISTPEWHLARSERIALFVWLMIQGRVTGNGFPRWTGAGKDSRTSDQHQRSEGKDSRTSDSVPHQRFCPAPAILSRTSDCDWRFPLAEMTWCTKRAKGGEDGGGGLGLRSGFGLEHEYEYEGDR